MKTYKGYLVHLLPIIISIIFSGCFTPLVQEIEVVRLSDNVQEDFQAGYPPDRSVYQYGQNSDKALDILYPVDPGNSTDIHKAHNYWVSRGSEIKINFETILKFRSYKPEKKFKKKGELKIPTQWMSVCTFRHPKTGYKLVDTDGDAVDINYPVEDASDMFKTYLKICSDNQYTLPFNTAPYGPYYGNCNSYALKTSNDPIDYRTKVTNKTYPLCLINGDMTIDGPTTLTWEVFVWSYNNDELKMEERHFSQRLEPTFHTLDRDHVTPYRVIMTPDSTNGNANLLKYTWQMPESDGLWQDNFASNISIDYIRFYWTDSRQELIPIIIPEHLGDPQLEIQVDTGNVCRDSDYDGIFPSSNCIFYGALNPASTKLNPITRHTWKMQLLYDEYYYELRENWNRPVIMEFGLKAD